MTLDQKKVGPIPITYQTLKEQYQALNLPISLLEPDEDFTIFDLADLKRDFPFKSPVSRLNFFVFVFVEDAHGHYDVDDKRYQITPGTVYFTNPGHWRSFTWLSVKSACLITMSESFLKENVHYSIFEEFPFLLSETFPGREVSEVQFMEFKKIYELIKLEQVSKSSFRRRTIGNLFVVILLKIKEIFWQNYDPYVEGQRDSVILRDFKLLFDKHYRDLALGLCKRIFLAQDYAAVLQLHPNYLNSVIKSKTGQAISYWIAGRNISEARSLLVNTQLSVKEVCHRMGFSTVAHFSSYFKRHTGVSPGQFRYESLSQQYQL